MFYNTSAAILAGSKHAKSIFVSRRLGMFSFLNILKSSFLFCFVLFCFFLCVCVCVFLFFKSVAETTSFLLIVHVNCFNWSKVIFRDFMKYYR